MSKAKNNTVTAKVTINAIVTGARTSANAVRAWFNPKTEELKSEPKSIAQGQCVKRRIANPENMDPSKVVYVFDRTSITATKLDERKKALLDSAEYKELGSNDKTSVRMAISRFAKAHGLSNGKARGNAGNAGTNGKGKAEKTEIETSAGVKAMTLEQLQSNLTTITRAWMKAHSFDKRALSASLEKTIHDAING